MNLLRIPKEIAYSDLLNKTVAFSASLHQKVEIPTPKRQPIRDLLDAKNPFDRGVEPGSLHYRQRSSKWLLRTKSLQPHSFLLYPKGDAAQGIVPSAFRNPQLKAGDILMSKDSNIGECGIVDGTRWEDYMFSSGILRLHPKINRLYFFAFLKHPIFKAQLQASVPRGATIKHAKSLWLDCLIPLPNQNNSDEVIEYVASLTQAILDKQIAIRDRAEKIISVIDDELKANQKHAQVSKYFYPAISDVTESLRLDACIYDRRYKQQINLIENYKYGYMTPKEAGFVVTPGPSLEIKIIRTRIDSEVPRKGFYALILPTHISLYGTLNALPYIGTGKALPILQKGDILFGEAGFHKGRSIVLLDHIDRCTTNAHGLYARRNDGDIDKSVFFRCIFDWYRTVGLIDMMAVGGSGGHFSPEYFDYLRIPNFPDFVKERVVRMYHNEVPVSYRPTDFTSTTGWHYARNKQLGLWQLNREMKELQGHLLGIQNSIIAGDSVSCVFHGG